MDLVWQELTLGLDSTRQAAQILLRLVAAVLFGFLVGMQREKAGKPAGVRTHGMVALGAALFTAVSVSASRVKGIRRGWPRRS